jgi:septum formation protein
MARSSLLGYETGRQPTSSMSLPRVILASASPRRAELLREIVAEFDVVPGHADEIQPEHLSPTEACMLNAYRKARVIAKKFPDALVIGADTEVVLNRRVFGKPRNRHEAAQMLADLAGKEHCVITGVCMVHLRRHRQRTFTDSTRVVFKPLEPDDIAAYLDQIDPLDKAGAYAIQQHGDQIVQRIEGSFSNVVGLPVEKLRKAVAEFRA